MLPPLSQGVSIKSWLFKTHQTAKIDAKSEQLIKKINKLLLWFPAARTPSWGHMLHTGSISLSWHLGIVLWDGFQLRVPSRWEACFLFAIHPPSFCTSLSQCPLTPGERKTEKNSQTTAHFWRPPALISNNSGAKMFTHPLSAPTPTPSISVLPKCLLWNPQGQSASFVTHHWEASLHVSLCIPVISLNNRKRNPAHKRMKTPVDAHCQATAGSIPVACC